MGQPTPHNNVMVITTVSRDLPLTPADAQRLGQAHALLQAGRAAEARAACETVLRLRPGQADALHLLALALRHLGDTAAARRAFNASLAVRPRQPQLLNNLGNMLGNLGQWQDALDAYSRALKFDPRFLDAWINRGLTALQAGDTSQAMRALEQATRLDPNAAKAWHGLGSARRAAGRITDAIHAFRRAVAIDPRNGAAWVNLGNCLRQDGEPAAALEAFDRAAGAGFIGPELADGRAGALLDLGDTERGIAGYRALAQTFPRYAIAHDVLAKLIWEHGLPEEPTAGFRAALGQHPHDQELWFGLVRTLLSQERWSDALEAIDAGLRALDDHPVLLYARARALSGLGDLAPATATFTRAAAMLPEDVALRVEFARHLLQARDPAAAAEHAEQATRLAPDAQAAWAYLGTAWRLLDDPREHWLHDYDRLVAPLVVEPPAAFSDEAAFATALETALLPLHTAITHPMEQSLRGGTQTRTMLFARKDPLIQALRAQIDDAIARHVASLPDDPAHPFLRRKTPRVRYTGAWSVRLRQQGYHVNHYHPEGWISSAFYVHLPESVTRSAANDHAGWIQFGQPPTEMGLDLPPRRHIQPCVGTLALFPSYTWHGTVPFQDEDARMTVAFDAVPDAT